VANFLARWQDTKAYQTDRGGHAALKTCPIGQEKFNRIGYFIFREV